MGNRTVVRNGQTLRVDEGDLDKYQGEGWKLQADRGDRRVVDMKPKDPKDPKESKERKDPKERDASTKGKSEE